MSDENNLVPEVLIESPKEAEEISDYQILQDDLVELIIKNVHLKIEHSDFKPETILHDVIVDSLDYCEFILALEEEYEIDILDEDINTWVTFKDLVDFMFKES